MADYHDRYFNSPDGLRLHYRDYPGGTHEQPPILCLPGLTRNVRDFEPVAERFAGDWRVIVLENRGRGDSAYDPAPKNYAPPVYAGDVMKMLDQLGIADAVFVGTSLGGIVTMLIAATDEDRIAGALLNDIGPELVQEGLDRIGSYVGIPVALDGWDAAAKHAEKGARDVYPGWGQAEWERYARRLMRERDDGKIVLDYDMAIRDNVIKGNTSANADPEAAWALLEGLKDRPVTILRGGLSDLFDERIASRMCQTLPQAEQVVLEDVGHAPSFDEPESLDALARLLGRVSG